MPETPEKTAEDCDLENSALYINREISLISFQWRVLDEAKDERNPLLERIKFLAIVDSNLDAFFMVRVGGLRMQRDAGVVDLSVDGLTPARMLASLRKESQKLMDEARHYLREELLPRLWEVGIRVMSYKDLSQRQKEAVDSYFNEVVFPV